MFIVEHRKYIVKYPEVEKKKPTEQIQTMFPLPIWKVMFKEVSDQTLESGAHNFAFQGL